MNNPKYIISETVNPYYTHTHTEVWKLSFDGDTTEDTLYVKYRIYDNGISLPQNTEILKIIKNEISRWQIEEFPTFVKLNRTFVYLNSDEELEEHLMLELI